MHYLKLHLSYCISSWGAIPNSKLQSVFAIQKRCIRLLFCTEYSYDHTGYYATEEVLYYNAYFVKLLNKQLFLLFYLNQCECCNKHGSVLF